MDTLEVTKIKKNQKIKNYLNSIEQGEGWVSLEKLEYVDCEYDEDLSSMHISLNEVLAEALQNNYELKVCEGVWALCKKGLVVNRK